MHAVPAPGKSLKANMLCRHRGDHLLRIRPPRALVHRTSRRTWQWHGHSGSEPLVLDRMSLPTLRGAAIAPMIYIEDLDRINESRVQRLEVTPGCGQSTSRSLRNYSGWL